MSAAQYARLIGLGPGVPAGNVAITSPQVNQSLQTHFLKLEYDNNLSPSTFFALRYYNWNQLDYEDNQYSLGPAQGGNSFWQVSGGPIVGTSLDLTHQFGSKLTVSLNGKYENQHPVWDAYEPQIYFPALSATPGPGSGPTLSDWLPGGYIYTHFGGNVPRIPSWGISYNGAFFQNWGAGVRFQYNPTSRVKTDLGVRYEGQNQHWFNQLGQYGLNPPGNPFSVIPSSWTSSTLNPTEWEPRAGVTYLMGVNDSLRVGYGRSAVFLNGQTAGTPFSAWGLGAYMNVPPLPGFPCGIQIKYTCRSYGEQLYWAGDAYADAPDAGNGKPALYSNYDLSYQHQFKNGWGARLTPFYKLGTNLPAASIIAILPGGGGVFGIGNQGFNRTSGLELNITTPERPVGLSGFFSATYQNVLGTTPPLVNFETSVPQLSAATLALGDIYRAGYVSPFSMRIGGTWAMKSGFRITPDLQYDVGYPYSSGNLVAARVGVDANGNPVYANVPQVNFGAGAAGVNRLFGIQNVSGTNLSTNYYDPAFPGTSLNPNVVATRGTPATAASGGYLSPANLQADLTLEYKRSGNTFGVQLRNLLGNAFVNAVPAVNPFYQPAANGLSGPRTGINNCQQQYGSARGCTNIPTDVYAYSNGAYLLSNGNFTGATELAPLRPFTLQVYYQRQL